jgi:tetratricopeptide (TPR) repeat protein
MRHLSIPLLVASLLLLGFMVLTYAGHLDGGPGIGAGFPWLAPREPVRPPSAVMCQQDRAHAYAERLRYEAFAYYGAGEYENALARLDQAQKYDPDGDLDVPELRDTRAKLLRHLGLDEPAAGADPSATPSPKATP